MKERNDKPRSLSNHVVSRYYRPPEIILLEKNYDQKIDMWSMGCIFAELLWSYQAKQASNKNQEGYHDNVWFELVFVVMI